MARLASAGLVAVAVAACAPPTPRQQPTPAIGPTPASAFLRRESGGALVVGVPESSYVMLFARSTRGGLVRLSVGGPTFGGYKSVAWAPAGTHLVWTIRSERSGTATTATGAAVLTEGLPAPPIQFVAVAGAAALGIPAVRGWMDPNFSPTSEWIPILGGSSNLGAERFDMSLDRPRPPEQARGGLYMLVRNAALPDGLVAEAMHVTWTSNPLEAARALAARLDATLIVQDRVR